MGRKSTACQNCRSIKSLCTKQLPCARCKRLLLACRYEPTSLLDNDHRKRCPKAGITKSKHTKSQTGCFSCRRRRKKCDEKQPACSDCERLRLTCIRPGHQAHEGGGRGEPGVESDVQESAGELLALDAIGLWTAIDSPARQGQDRTAGLTSFSDWLALVETENIAETINNANLTGSTALVNTGHFGEDGSENVATFLPRTALNKLVGVSLDAVAKWRAVERYLLDHFLQSVSRALVIAEDTINPFLRVVVPMGLENTMVKHALFALSACHLSRIYPVFENDFYFHRSKALQELMCELENLTASICAVAATLLLTFAEICTGTSRKWIIHLHGARALLQGSYDMTGSPADTLIEIYNYLSCMSSLTSEMAPGRLGDNLQLSSSSVTSSTSAFIHPLLGLSTSIFESLASISRFASRTRNKTPLLEELEETREIERALKAWQPPKVPALNETRNFTEARALGFALQQAAIMRLQQITKRLENDDPQITKAADGILSALSLIRPGSEMEAHMLFPLFMAGVGSITKPHRLTIEYRLNVMEATIGFGNISIAHKILDEIWRNANEGELMDWEELIRSKYPAFIFL